LLGHAERGQESAFDLAISALECLLLIISQKARLPHPIIAQNPPSKAAKRSIHTHDVVCGPCRYLRETRDAGFSELRSEPRTNAFHTGQIVRALVQPNGDDRGFNWSMRFYWDITRRYVLRGEFKRYSNGRRYSGINGVPHPPGLPVVPAERCLQLIILGWPATSKQQYRNDYGGQNHEPGEPSRTIHRAFLPACFESTDADHAGPTG
jgi:hypothetical protein